MKIKDFCPYCGATTVSELRVSDNVHPSAVCQRCHGVFDTANFYHNVSAERIQQIAADGAPYGLYFAANGKRCYGLYCQENGKILKSFTDVARCRNWLATISDDVAAAERTSEGVCVA